jgi:hypothetical protein
MYKAVGRIFAVLLSGIIAVGGGVIPALAADADFNGQGATNVWQYDTIGVTAYGYDAFGAAMKDLAPGDVRTVTVQLRNNTSDDVEFRLVAEPLTGEEARALETYFPGKTADDTLLDAIEISVSHGITPLYVGTLRGLALSGTADMYTTAGVSLGRVSAAYSGLITVVLSLPASLGPEAMDKLCAVEWRFVATQYNDEPEEPGPGPGPDPGPGPGPGPTPPPTGGSTTPGGTTPGDDTPPVIDDTPIVDLPGGDTPLGPGTPGGPDVIIDTEDTPPAPGPSAWALMNLILTIVSALFMLGLLGRFIYAVARRGDDDEDEEEEALEEEDDDRHLERRLVRKGIASLLAAIGLVVTVILFIFTENMRLPMEIINKYTIIYACVVIIQLILLALSFNKRRRRR